MIRSIYITLVFLASLSFAAWPGEKRGIREASGIARMGDEILIVGDEDAGTYFRYKLPSGESPLIPLKNKLLKNVVWAGLPIVIDQEAIDILADGRVVILSERLRSLMDKNGVVAEYPQMTAESGNRGLEGLAVRKMKDGTSRVAALWEGGYPRYSGLPPAYREKVGRNAMRPLLLLHDIEDGDRGIRLKEKDLYIREFEVPLPPGLEPEAQRFRAPALVWHRFERAGHREWGLILLLSSEYSLPPRAGSVEDCGGIYPGKKGDRYCMKLLQKFDLDGLPVGDPLNLTQLLPADIADRNWEGMDWYEEGKSLILIYEEDPDKAGFAFVINLPDRW